MIKLLTGIDFWGHDELVTKYSNNGNQKFGGEIAFRSRLEAEIAKGDWFIEKKKISIKSRSGFIFEGRRDL